MLWTSAYARKQARIQPKVASHFIFGEAILISYSKEPRLRGKRSKAASARALQSATVSTHSSCIRTARSRILAAASYWALISLRVCISCRRLHITSSSSILLSPSLTLIVTHFPPASWVSFKDQTIPAATTANSNHEILGGGMMHDDGGGGLLGFKEETAGQTDADLLFGMQEGEELGLVFEIGASRITE